MVPFNDLHFHNIFSLLADYAITPKNMVNYAIAPKKSAIYAIAQKKKPITPH